MIISCLRIIRASVSFHLSGELRAYCSVRLRELHEQEGTHVQAPLNPTPLHLAT